MYYIVSKYLYILYIIKNFMSFDLTSRNKYKSLDFLLEHGIVEGISYNCSSLFIHSVPEQSPSD